MLSVNAVYVYCSTFLLVETMLLVWLHPKALMYFV